MSNETNDAVVELPLCGVIRTRGEWCPSCLLPSAFTVDVYGLSETGISYLGPETTCSDCDWSDESSL